MKAENELDPVIVFTGTTWQAGMVISLLENSGIEAYQLDGASGTYNPGWNLPGEGGSVRVMVALQDFGEAKTVVLEYQNNLKS